MRGSAEWFEKYGSQIPVTRRAEALGLSAAFDEMLDGRKCVGVSSQNGRSLLFTVQPKEDLSFKPKMLGRRRQLSVYTRESLYEDEHTNGCVRVLDGERRAYIADDAWKAMVTARQGHSYREEVLHRLIWALRNQRANPRVYYEVTGTEVRVRAVISVRLGREFYEGASLGCMNRPAGGTALREAGELI